MAIKTTSDCFREGWRIVKSTTWDPVELQIIDTESDSGQMSKFRQHHHPTFRQEICGPLFELIRSGESLVVAGVAGLGKSRLLQFLMRSETINQYLQENAKSMLLAWVDCNRMAELSPWGLYELLLTALIERASSVSRLRPVCERLLPLRSGTIVERNHLLAQRNLELALRMLCSEYEVNVVFILDEFDESYTTLPPQALANLRALRDANKYRLCYALFMREHPAILRNPDDCEGFYELLSRSVLYLQPYSREDALETIRSICHRRNIELLHGDGDAREIVRLSGGHPGIMVGILDALTDGVPEGTDWEWAASNLKVQEECRKIWEGLQANEQRALHHLASGVTLRLKDKEPLLEKGLLVGGATDEPSFGIPLFKHYVLNQAEMVESGLRLDRSTGIVWVNGQPSEELTGKEYDLVEFMGGRINQLCSSDDIILHLWPGDEGFEINPNTVAALVRRVRRKIEPNPSRPKYLISVKGRGYRLLEQA